jgi:hypothetical protein
MALQNSGQISLNDIHIEAGGSTGTQAGLNDSDIRGLIDKASGAQSAFGDFYGASAYSPATYIGTTTVSGSVNNTGITIDPANAGAQVGDLIILSGGGSGQTDNPAVTVGTGTNVTTHRKTGTLTAYSSTATLLVSYIYQGSTARWLTTSTGSYSGTPAACSVAVFRGPTSVAEVSAGAAPHEDHAGFIAYDYSRGSFQTAPSLENISTFTNASYRLVSVAGTYSNGFSYDHLWSYGYRVEYNVGGTANFPSDSVYERLEMRN